MGQPSSNAQETGPSRLVRIVGGYLALSKRGIIRLEREVLGMSDNSNVGRPRTVTDDDIVTVLREADTPVLTTAMIAEELPIGSRGLLDRLKALREEGRLESLDVGPRAQVWWVTKNTDETPNFRKGFGSASGTNFAEGVERAREEFDQDFEERHESLFGQ